MQKRVTIALIIGHHGVPVLIFTTTIFFLPYPAPDAFLLAPLAIVLSLVRLYIFSVLENAQSGKISTC